MVYTFWNFACVTSLHFSSNQWTAGRGGKKTNIWLCFIIHYDTFVERTKEHKNTNIVHLGKGYGFVIISTTSISSLLFSFVFFFILFFFSLKNYMLYVFSSKWWKPCWYFIFLIMILNQIKILKLLQVFR